MDPIIAIGLFVLAIAGAGFLIWRSNKEDNIVIIPRGNTSSNVHHYHGHHGGNTSNTWS